MCFVHLRQILHGITLLVGYGFLAVRLVNRTWTKMDDDPCLRIPLDELSDFFPNYDGVRLQKSYFWCEFGPTSFCGPYSLLSEKNDQSIISSTKHRAIVAKSSIYFIARAVATCILQTSITLDPVCLASFVSLMIHCTFSFFIYSGVVRWTLP